MDFNQPFSVLNEKLRPRVTTSEQLYSSLTRLEGRQLGSLRNKYTYYRATVLPREPEPNATTKTEDPEESVDETEKDYSKGNTGKNTCLINELNLNDIGEDELGDEESTSQSDEKDSMGEVASEEARDSEELGSNENTNSFQRDYLDGTLPDLLNSGKPLSRRRTLGHYSDTLKEVRREVELSRRRSIKLKAQVDKLQESREGQGWSQHKDRVTEEVLSILRLLHPLTEPESSQIEPPDGENRLDAALAQLQNVARKLAISHTKQESKPGGKVAEDSAILQQALRDRDEAIEKKKAMEAELLRSKTEMMTLNNHLLEAAQKRLELSLELEAWKKFMEYRNERGKMLLSRRNQLLLEFSFWNEPVPRPGPNIYELRSYQLRPGTMIEWGNYWARAIEIRQQNQEAVGGFFSQIGSLYTVHHLWAYKDLQSREDTRNAAWQRDGWDEVVYYTVPLIQHMESRIMIPMKTSPLK